MALSSEAAFLFVFVLCEIAFGQQPPGKCLTVGQLCSCIDLDAGNLSAETVGQCCSSNVSRLVISNVPVTTLPSNLFTSVPCTNVRTIRLSETSLTILTNGTFNGLSGLSTIVVYNNKKLESYGGNVFAPLNKTLVTLTLHDNPVRTITAKTFLGLGNLQTLTLTNNRIGYLDKRSFADCGQLRQLNLQSNILIDIEVDTFYGLHNLEELNLEDNPVQKIEMDTFKYLGNLRTLTLSHHDYFQYGGFQRLPDRIFFPLSDLRRLNITGLKLSHVTELTFYGLGELQHLNLRGNRLHNVSRTALQKLQRLQSLDLSNNRIQCLHPASFADLTYLRTLDLSQNRITYLADNAFDGLGSLTVLNLAENPIQIIEANALFSLQNLKYLQVNSLYRRGSRDLRRGLSLSPFSRLPNSTVIIGLADYDGLGLPQANTTVSSSLCPLVLDDPWDDLYDRPNGSRKYLLVIIAICISFLLIAFAVIMSYRAWSKRKLIMGGGLDGDVLEKQEMLVRVSHHFDMDSFVEKHQLNHQHPSPTKLTMPDDSLTKMVPPRPHSNNNTATTGHEQPALNNNVSGSGHLITKDLVRPASGLKDDSLTPLGIL